MWAISMTPLRVAMPNRVMKPMIDATDRTPPETKTPITPPISASGRLSITSRASRTERNATNSSRKMPTVTAAPEQQQGAGRLLGALELAAVLDVVALGQRHRVADAAADVLDHAVQVAPGDVGHHHDLALHVLAADDVGAAVLADVGQRGQRQPRPAGRGDESGAQGFEVCRAPTGS